MIQQLKYARTHCGPTGMWVWVVWKFGNRAQRSRAAVRLLYRILDFIIVRSWAGARIPAKVTIGERVGFVHDALGVVIHPNVQIGNDCTIYHGVTIGHVWGKNSGDPIIGDGVLIGAGATVLGPVRIGDYAAVGAGAVVTKDVPDGATAVGNPARIIPPKDDWERRPRH